MNLFVLKSILSSQEDFIRFWSNLYMDQHENYYISNIGKPLTPDNVRELFLWKNSGGASDLKKKTIEKYFVASIEEANNLSKNITPKEFLNRFRRGGVIWRIFFLHIWQPQKYPIYDQHVYRAMTFLCKGKKEEIPKRDKDKIESYLAHYIPFYKQFKDDENRSVDKALWTFGKFLKSQYGEILNN